MTKKIGSPKARHAVWKDGDQEIPMIFIYSGPIFARIPYSEARRIVDEVHDLCDAHEAEQRDQD